MQITVNYGGFYNLFVMLPYSSAHLLISCLLLMFKKKTIAKLIEIQEYLKKKRSLLLQSLSAVLNKH